MKILISIDDTDNLDSPGSGQAAERLAKGLQDLGMAECSNITRHQLYVHEDIPYTSHNSAMCFSASTDKAHVDTIIRFGEEFLQKESAVGSDPGLCVAVVDSHLDKEALIAFGLTAKKNILTKQDAYGLANKLGVHLSEHGGTGGGVIGALAAIGLRLQGNDGRFRGWYHFGKAGETFTPADMCAHDHVDAVVDVNGGLLENEALVVFAEDTVKTVLLCGAQVIPVARLTNARNGAMWATLSKKEVKHF
jgi:hypothetical protein